MPTGCPWEAWAILVPPSLHKPKHQVKLFFMALHVLLFFFFFAFLAVWGCCSSRTNPKWPAAAAGGQGIEPRTWSGRLGGRSEGAMGRRARTMRDKFPAGGDAAKEGRRRSLVGRVPKVNRQ